MAQINEDFITEGVHDYSSETGYILPPSPIKEKLEDFKDMKLGFMMHWGLYAQLGLIASWGLVDSEKSWSRAINEYGDKPTWHDDGAKIREEYFSLINSFNPIRFDPDEWAELAANNCFKYLIFTTKHHDGFCLWDTKQTDFKVTSPECPFSKHEKADIVKNVFDAFRKKGIAIGAYFSKPDWHNENYWEKDFCGETTRMPTYDINEKPEKWDAFTSFTHKQMTELVRDYGKVDILWLDGGQVCKKRGLDIKTDQIVPELRKINPELIVADRTAGGEYENYITPEQTIPEGVMSAPWESCLTLGKDFHYIYDDDYKSPDMLVEMLMDIVCKGGNLVLNVSPQPDGRIPRNAVKSLNGFGNWLKKYGESVFSTRPCYPYKNDKIFFTQNEGYIYAACKDFCGNTIPCPHGVSSVELLNRGELIDFEQKNGEIILSSRPVTDEAFCVFKMKKNTEA